MTKQKTESQNQLTIYGTIWCSDCKRTKQFLGEQRVPYVWVDVEQSPEGLAFIEKTQNGGHSVPMLAFPDGTTMVEPSNAALAHKLGIPTRAKCDFYDVVIVGGGPAGLTASFYLAREGYSTLVIEKAGLGGQIGITETLDNFPGFPEGISGAQFTRRLVEQARRFGVETVAAQSVTGIRADADYRVVTTEDGHEYSTKAVLIATGSRYKRLNVTGEDGLIGSSVHYCATCDGPFYKGKHVVVIGDGNSAAEEGVFLTNFAEHVTMLIRGPQLTAGQVAIDKVNERDDITVLYNTEVVEFRGKHSIDEVIVRDLETGETRPLDPKPDGVFVFVGLSPNSDFLPGEIERDPNGFVITSHTLETSFPGVFAAGDIRLGSTKQAASAAGEGATAALMIRDYLRMKG